MMTCEEVLRELERYCDGEVSAERAALIDEHLRGCVHCVDRRDFRFRLQEIVRRKCGMVELPEDLERRVRAILGLVPR